MDEREWANATAADINKPKRGATSYNPTYVSGQS
jgi:hypothetical protein